MPLLPIPAKQFEIAQIGMERFMRTGAVAGPPRGALHELISRTIDAHPADVAQIDPFYGVLEPYERAAAYLENRYPEGTEMPQRERAFTERVSRVRDVGALAIAARTIDERDNARLTFGNVFIKPSALVPDRPAAVR